MADREPKPPRATLHRSQSPQQNPRGTLLGQPPAPPVRGQTLVALPNEAPAPAGNLRPQTVGVPDEGIDSATLMAGDELALHGAGSNRHRQTAAGLSAAAQRTAPPTSRKTFASTAIRRYADGVLTTSTRETVDGADPAQVVGLPYSSDEVLSRLGPYDILDELGRGGMGVVYRAYSLRLCRPCAIKVMLPGPQVSEAQILRFQNEAMLAARVSHPNIVQIFDAGEEEGRFFFVMELVEGQPLDKLALDPSIAVEQLALIVAQCARGLHEAHEHGIVHRDIKPENILVDAQLEPHITDFGIAANVKTDRRMTHDGFVMGTPDFMSPEQVNGELASIGPASDVYSLGATLFLLVSGRELFEAETITELLDKARYEEPAAPSRVAPTHSKRDIPPDLDNICLKALEKQTSRRYASALALAEDLEAFAQGRPVSARPISTVERLHKLVRRNREAFAVASIVFATLLVIGVSFAIVTVSTVNRTSATIREQDVQAGLEQAATLERAIRTNMLQGRADVVRELVQELREDPGTKSIDVVRVDRTFAYTDLSTRKRVQRRLRDPLVLAKIAKDRPEFMDKVEEVQRLAFKNIDARGMAMSGLFDYDRDAWSEIAEQLETRVERSEIDGEPVLTVFSPLENSEECQVCHGGPGEGTYGENLVRAVLVVRRSQQAVEDQIARNRKLAWVVGVSTSAAILALLWLFAGIFGLRFRRARFADV